MLKRVLPHLCLIISFMMLTFLVIDHFNQAMNFIGNDVFKVLLLIYSLAVIVASIYLIAGNRRGY
jgi:hypothetical protein